jgi:dTDP-4-amino-4,6-dideoxygalactose transaminase
LEDFGFDLEDFHKKITGNTLGAVVVHLFGVPANIQAIANYSRKNDIYLIEDAAQAFGNTMLDLSGSKLGLQGDMGFFSFGRGKPLSLLHGGFLAVNSENFLGGVEGIYKNLGHNGSLRGIRYAFMLLAYRLFQNPYFYRFPQMIPSLHLGETIFEEGFNTFPGLDLAAMLINEMLDGIEKEKAIRAENSHFYSSHLRKFLEVQNLLVDDYPFLRYPLLIKNIEKRRLIQKKLSEGGIGGVKFYPFPLNGIPVLKEILQDNAQYRNAQQIAERLITLPVHSGLTPKHREGIVKIIEREIIQ